MHVYSNIENRVLRARILYEPPRLKKFETGIEQFSNMV